MCYKKQAVKVLLSALCIVLKFGNILNYKGFRTFLQTTCNTIREKLTIQTRACICNHLWSPRIDSEKSIPPAYVVWQAGTKNGVVVLTRQAGNRFLGFSTGLQIWAQGVSRHVVYQMQGGGGGVAGSQLMSTAVHITWHWLSPNKLWRSTSLFNLWFRRTIVSAVHHFSLKIIH
jgi:hypothetical protein